MGDTSAVQPDAVSDEPVIEPENSISIPRPPRKNAATREAISCPSRLTLRGTRILRMQNQKCQKEASAGYKPRINMTGRKTGEGEGLAGAWGPGGQLLCSSSPQ